MGRHRSPEGTRVFRGKLRTTLGAILLLCAAFAVAIGDETAKLTVMNRTPNVLTIVIADRTWKSVAAGSGVTYAASDSASVQVRVAYAPGQGVEGSAQRSFVLVHHSVSQGSYTYIACGVNAPITTPNPIQWDVTADTLAASGS
jgi:hypothetical protein